LLFLLNIALEYADRKVQENQVGLNLNETHQPLVYTDYVNLLGDNKNTIKNTDALTDDSKEVGLEVNTDNTMSTGPYPEPYRSNPLHSIPSL
jgi:hypothetical protein